jgi:hypothetical protein
MVPEINEVHCTTKAATQVSLGEYLTAIATY